MSRQCHNLLNLLYSTVLVAMCCLCFVIGAGAAAVGSRLAQNIRITQKRRQLKCDSHHHKQCDFYCMILVLFCFVCVASERISATCLCELMGVRKYWYFVMN